MTQIQIVRAGPLATVQDAGRFGMLRHGLSASGPMDRRSFALAGARLGSAGSAGLEFTRAGLAFAVRGGPLRASFSGGEFHLLVNGSIQEWPSTSDLDDGDEVDIRPGGAGNFGYVRFSGEIDVPVVLGSRATSTIARIGGRGGRALQAGDLLTVSKGGTNVSAPREQSEGGGPLRFIWGIHADRFPADARLRFVQSTFAVSGRMDRMGVRLVDREKVFAGLQMLSLVSEPVVPGDIQILGDGTPIVLMRDHQPTGGYPRIGTIATADLDRFAQIRPGTEVSFFPMTAARAQALLEAAR